MNKELIEEFYLLALVDITNGRSIEELEAVIDIYEEGEEYEACAGIKKAMEEAGYKTIRELISTINEIDNEPRND